MPNVFNIHRGQFSCRCLLLVSSDVMGVCACLSVREGGAVADAADWFNTLVNTKLHLDCLYIDCVYIDCA